MYQVQSLQLLTSNLTATAAAIRYLKSKTLRNFEKAGESSPVSAYDDYTRLLILSPFHDMLYILISSLPQSGISKWIKYNFSLDIDTKEHSS